MSVFEMSQQIPFQLFAGYFTPATVIRIAKNITVIENI